MITISCVNIVPTAMDLASVNPGENPITQDAEHKAIVSSMASVATAS